MNTAGANIYRLVREIRQTGAAGDWPGDSAISEAVNAIFGDPVIAGLPEAGKIDEFAVAVTASWALLSAGDEYLAGVDINFLEIDPNTAGGWGISAASTRQLLLRVTEIYESTAAPAAIASLAAFIALSLDQQADRAIAVWSASRDRLRTRPGELAMTHADSPPADYLVAEFGHRSLRPGEQAGALARALEVIGPHCTDRAAASPAPRFPSEPFSADEDQFFRQVITSRLGRLWTARSSAAMPWPPPCHQALLPLAGYVAARAATDRTRDLAVLLGNISLGARVEALRSKRLLDWTSQIPNAGQFARRLYKRGLFIAPVLGAVFALIGELIPDWLAAFVATIGLIAVIRLVSSARRKARYTAMTYPTAGSLLAGVALSALYCAGEVFSFWLQNGASAGSVVPGLVASFAIGAATLTLAVRYGAPFTVSRSVFLPDGARTNSGTRSMSSPASFPIGLPRSFESADSSWEELFKQRAEWAPSPLGRPQEALLASAEAVDLLRRLAQANPAGFDPGFGASLHEFSWRLCQLDDQKGAEPFAIEAVQVRSRQVKANRAYEPALAGDLLLLGSLQLDIERLAEALPALQRAVEIFRRLAPADPSYQGSLARSLTILGLVLMQSGRSDNALECTEEAVRILRPRAAEDPSLRDDLSLSLETAAATLQDERPEEGLVYAAEAVRTRRALAPGDPRARVKLGRSLAQAGRLRSAAGRPDEAVAPIEEAARIFRPMAQANPLGYAMLFAETLRSQSRALSAAGQPQEALASLEELARTLRPLVEADQSLVGPVLADALEGLGKIRSELGQADEARAALEESVQLLGPPAAARPGPTAAPSAGSRPGR